MDRKWWAFNKEGKEWAVREDAGGIMEDEDEGEFEAMSIEKAMMSNWNKSNFDLK